MNICIAFVTIFFCSGFVQGQQFFEELARLSQQGGNFHLPKTGPAVESLLFRSCYVCHGTSISAVTSSCWETVDEDHKRFVAVDSCFGACSITVLNHTSIGLVDYTRRCEPNCTERCHRTDQNTQLCKYCCYGDRCNDVLPTYVPKRPEAINAISEGNLRSWLKGAMAKPRHHASDPSNKIAARKLIANTWRDFGLPSEMQEFTIAQTVQEDRSPFNYVSYIKTVIKGYNIIATIRGRYYGTLRDKIILIMAHYDTHSGGTPGVNDNASGVAALLELVRLLNRDVSCHREHSIMMVATDFKEEGSYWEGLHGRDYTNCITGDIYEGITGASHFLCGYLLPHLRRTGSRLMIAINLHSLLNYDASPASQSLPDLQDFITGHSRYSNAYYRRFESQVSRRRYVGDWLLASYVQVQANSKTTQYFSDKLQRKWREVEKRNFDADFIKQHIPVDGHENVIMQLDDCLPFMRLRQPLSCISLTDTGSLRGYMRRCHEKSCDDSSHVTDEKIKFLAKVTDVVWRTIEELSRSSCIPQTEPPKPALAPNNGRSRASSRRNNSKKKRRCNLPLLKSAARNKNNSVLVTATCRYSRRGLEVCTPPSDGLWALINSGTAWIPRKSNKKSSQRLWFQVDFGRRVNVVAISLQGVRGQGFLRSFMVSYSNDGRSWSWHIPVKPLPKTATEIRGVKIIKRIAKRRLKPRITARFVRIHPRRWRKRIALRLELHGCS